MNPPGGVGSASYNPGAISTAAAPNPWQPFFGEPQRDVKINPYGAYGRENWTLPDAYKGSLPYMTTLMIHMISDEDLWPTRVVCPIRVTEEEMEIVWDEVVFNDHLLGPVPEEGVSRLVTQQTNERRDHYVRYGIALILEHGFMKTAKGQQAYSMNLQQIRNATLETMYFGVIEALLRSKQYSQAWTRRYGMQARSGAALRGFLGDEVERYMVVQKTEYGFDMLDAKAKKYLRASGVTPDTWILPEGTSTFLSLVRPEKRDYLLAGPAGQASFRNAITQEQPPLVQSSGANACTVFESKSFDVPGAPGPIDPLTRNVSVGEYVTMVDTASDVVAAPEYKSFMRDIYVYNEQRDDFSRITLRNALKACCRFDENGELFFPPGFRGGGGDSDPDPFVKSDLTPVYTFGDMRESSFSEATARKVAQGIVSKFLDKMSGGAMKDYNWDDMKLSPAAAGANLVDFRRRACLKAFYEFVKERLGDSRVFQKAYAPGWRRADWFTAGDAVTQTDTIPLGGFWLNTICEQLPRAPEPGDQWNLNRGDITAEVALQNITAIFKKVLSTPENPNPPSPFTDAGISWDVVRTALGRLISSSDEPSISEVALNNSTLDKFITRIQMFNKQQFGAGPGIRTVILLYNIAVLIEESLKFKDLMIRADAGKHYAFVLHKALLALSNARGDQNLPDAAAAAAAIVAANPKTITEIFAQYLAAIVDHDNLPGINSPFQFKKDSAAVTRALWGTQAFADAIANAGGAPPPPPPPAGTAVTFGAFDVPALNAHYGAMGDEYDEDMMRGAKKQRTGSGVRFGAVRRLEADELAHRRAEANGEGEGFDDVNIDLTRLRGAVPGFNPAMMERYSEIKTGTDPVLVKSVLLTLLHTPVTEKSLMRLIDFDVPFPFEFILFRPRITHQMATGILLKKGPETGETLIGHADFQMSDDVVRKLHYGNFTLYSKTVVWKSDNVYLAENIVATGYIGGNDVAMNTMGSLYPVNGSNPDGPRSMYVAMVPVSGAASEDATSSAGGGYFNPMDITGSFASATMPHLSNLDAEVGNGNGATHYPGAAFYSLVWRLSNKAQRNYVAEYVPLSVAHDNTLCFQGHQMAYNPGSKAFDLTTVNTGHFGDRVYPGCGKVRRMANQKYLQPISFTTAFGASAQVTSIIT